MRKLVAGLTLVVVASACSGGSNSADPVPTIESDAPTANLEQGQVASSTSSVAETLSTTAPEPAIEPDTLEVNLELDQAASTSTTMAKASSPVSTTAPEATASSAITVEPAAEDMAPESTSESESESESGSESEPEPESDGPSDDQPFNPFRTADLDLRDCLVTVFGQILHDELRNRQPTLDEDAAMGPCMADFMAPADPDLTGSDDDDGPSTNQPFNPFTSTDPDLRDCLIAALGQQTYDELSTRQPEADEQQTMGPCMGPPPDGTGPTDTATPEGPVGPAPSAESAREVYPPQLTGQLLLGYIPAPPGFDDCIIGRIGGNRLGEIRSKQPPTSSENDRAAECLFQLQVPVSLLNDQGGQASGEPGDDGGPVGPADPNSGQDGPEETIMVTYPSTTYPVAPGGTSGFFTTTQDADITLSAFGFNDTGGPLKFNRPSGLTSDGTRLVMTDVFNNRVLIWNTAPTHSNQTPDLVLGQPNFTTNEPGTGRSQLNWPVSASTDGTRLAVTDTMNDRILIWTEFPTTNAEPADIVLQGGSNAEPSKSTISWPWGVWTDGNRLVVASTVSRSVLIWNTFPTYDGQPADLLLTGSGDFGTPRHITSDGNSLIVGDHNATARGGDEAGTFFWTSFPTTDDQPYDFFVVDPQGEKRTAPWLKGDFSADGRLLMMGDTVHMWNELPKSASTRPDLSNLGQGLVGGYDFMWGDFSYLTVVEERVYITTNGSTLVVYNSIPTSATQKPDFVIGASDIFADAHEENFIISNPVPASNGTNLFVTSDKDNRLFVWTSLPNRSGATPDLVYHLCWYRNEETRQRRQCEGLVHVWDNTLHGDTFALAGRDRLIIWTELPLEGNLPAYDFTGRVGGVTFSDLAGVAMDDSYFYLADAGANAVYVWNGVPDGTTEPLVTLQVNEPSRLSSSGTWLAVNSTAEREVMLYEVDQVTTPGYSPFAGGAPSPGVERDFYLSNGATVSHGHLFIAHQERNQIWVWEDVVDAIENRPPDAILGASGVSDTQPEISRNQMFWPAIASFDGSYLWVGEVKFSGRLVRFSPTG